MRSWLSTLKWVLPHPLHRHLALLMCGEGEGPGHFSRLFVCFEGGEEESHKTLQQTDQRLTLLLALVQLVVQRWPKRFVLGCVNPPLAAEASSRNLGQPFLPSLYPYHPLSPHLSTLHRLSAETMSNFDLRTIALNFKVFLDGDVLTLESEDTFYNTYSTKRRD